MQGEIQRKEQPGCSWLEEDVSEPFLINNSTISTLVCRFTTDSVSDFGGAQRAWLQSKRQPGAGAPFFVFMMGLGCVKEQKETFGNVFWTLNLGTQQKFTHYSLVGVTSLRTWKSVARQGHWVHGWCSDHCIFLFCPPGIEFAGKKIERSGNFIKPEV